MRQKRQTRRNEEATETIDNLEFKKKNLITTIFIIKLSNNYLILTITSLLTLFTSNSSLYYINSNSNLILSVSLSKLKQTTFSPLL